MVVKLENVTLLHDGDLFAYRASSATDGRQYAVSWMSEDDDTHLEFFKYKKDADVKAAEVEGTVVLSYQPEPETHALHIIKQLIQQVEQDLRGKIIGPVIASEHFLTNKGSFRERLVPTYKANRKDIRRPEHLFSCKQYIINKHGGICRDGEYEADDLLAMGMVKTQKAGGTPICVSMDKDLKQVSGWHWDFVKKQLLYVTEEQGNRNFYRQLLMGDPTDGIIGIYGMGPKTAAKLIDHLSTPFQMYVECLKQWLKYLKQEATEETGEYLKRVVRHVNLNAQLLYLVREEGKHWTEPEDDGSM